MDSEKFRQARAEVVAGIEREYREWQERKQQEVDRHRAAARRIGGISWLCLLLILARAEVRVMTDLTDWTAWFFLSGCLAWPLLMAWIEDDDRRCE